MTEDTAETGERWSKKEHHRETRTEKQMERNSKPVVYFALKTPGRQSLCFFLSYDKTTSSLQTYDIPDWGYLELKLSPAVWLLATTEWFLHVSVLTVLTLDYTRPSERLRQ